MAAVAAVEDVGVGVMVGAEVGAAVGVDVVPPVELLPHATSNKTIATLQKASIVPFDTKCKCFNIRSFFLHFL